MKIDEQIVAWAKNGDDRNDIARKLYLILPTAAFAGKADDQYKVFLQVSKKLDVPISSIQVVGSAKTGISLIKGTEFNPENSDLDIAIVDSLLFIKLFERSFSVSSGFNNGTLFTDASMREQFLFNIQRGIFVPRMMPSCGEKANWHLLFGDLTREFKPLFKNVSAYVYASETFFEAKQIEAIKYFLASKGIEK